MLTNGKKIWGIWNGASFMCDETTLHILIYDDLEVVKQQISSMHIREPKGEQIFEPRVISTGNSGRMETKTA